MFALYMRVGDHILNDFKPLGIDEELAAVLQAMEELKCSHLPVLDNGKYLGLISEDDLMDIEDTEDRIEEHLKVLKPYQVLDTTHIYEAIKVFGEGNLSCLPVLNEEGKYIGYLSPLELMWDLGQQVSYAEKGAVIVLQVSVRDYHISQIAQIIESEDALILGLQLRSEGTELLRVAIKINQSDLSRIVKAFERYQYNVVELYHESIFDDTASDRYEGLVKYLNI
ncbi:MAG: CBS domain-containing protein [Bacteroidetes bacterium]|nr:CBS domain-containing protein [Bacteroidota bacterium]